MTKVIWFYFILFAGTEVLTQSLTPAKLLCQLNDLVLKEDGRRVLVAHACNPRYPGGRDQEDHSLKPARVNSSTRPYLKKTFKVKALNSNLITAKKKKEKM
jgi:hypothetical protein